MASDVKIVGGAPQPSSFGTKDIESIVEALFQAQRVAVKPTDYGGNGNGLILGHYRLGVATGLTTGIAAAGAIFSMRWAYQQGLFLLKRVRARAILTTAFGTAQATDLDIVTQRGFSAPDTGGTAITLTGDNQKNRKTIMSGSQVVASGGDMRVATTAALGAGTKTADAQAFGVAAFPNTNAIGTGGVDTLYDYTQTGQHPILFQINEGFNIRLITAQGATGVVKFYIELDWAEVVGF